MRIGEIEIDPESANRLGFHPASDESRPLHQQVRRHFMWLDTWVKENVPAGREQSLARTALQEASLWSNAAIATNLAPLKVDPGTFDDE